MRFAPIVVVLLSLALQWYSHAGGLLYTPDSCSYMAATKTFDGYLHWPPLFPVVLFVFGSVWYWMQLLITGAIGILVINQTKKMIADPVLQLLCLISIMLGVHLLMIGVFLWSELLFVLILLCFVKALEEDRFVLAIILGFLLCLQRHAGLFFVIGAAVWMWDLRRSLLLLFISSSGFVAWNIYASVIDDNQYLHSIPQNLSVMSASMMRSLLPIPGIFLLIVVGVMIYFLRSDKKTRLMSILVLTYFFGMICLVLFLVDDIERFMAVVIPFFMILVFRTLEMVAARQTSVARKMLIVLVICWLMYPLSRTVKNAVQWHNLSFTSYFCPV